MSMSRSANRDVEELLDRLPSEIAEAIRAGEAESIGHGDHEEFNSEELPYPYNLEGAEQIDR